MNVRCGIMPVLCSVSHSAKNRHNPTAFLYAIEHAIRRNLPVCFACMTSQLLLIGVFTVTTQHTLSPLTRLLETYNLQMCSNSVGLVFRVRVVLALHDGIVVQGSCKNTTKKIATRHDQGRSHSAQ